MYNTSEGISFIPCLEFACGRMLHDSILSLYHTMHFLFQQQPPFCGDNRKKTIDKVCFTCSGGRGGRRAVVITGRRQ